MKVALLGGSFNPLHIGHCALADCAATELGYDKILFVPVFLPPHKTMRDAPSAADRLAMIREFCRGDSRFEAEPYEVERGGISYTCDTLRYVAEKYRGSLDGRPALIMGQDTAAEFDKWQRAAEIAREADLIIARRFPGSNGIDTAAFQNVPTGNYTGVFDPSSFERDFRHDYIPLKNPPFPVSSTEIRARIADGLGWRYLVPSAVFQYIREHRLYGAKDEG